MVSDKVPRLSRDERRRAAKESATQSAGLARRLMALKEREFDELKLDDDLRDEIQRARRITAKNARRREERRLAGVLRGIDLTELADQLDASGQSHYNESARFKLAEAWRERLMEDPAALDEFLERWPDQDLKHWTSLVANARRHRETGKPKAAFRQLFQQVMAVLAAAD